jgi:hypothetical protein
MYDTSAYLRHPELVRYLTSCVQSDESAKRNSDQMQAKILEGVFERSTMFRNIASCTRVRVDKIELREDSKIECSLSYPMWWCLDDMGNMDSYSVRLTLDT